MLKEFWRYPHQIGVHNRNNKVEGNGIAVTKDGTIFLRNFIVGEWGTGNFITIIGNEGIIRVGEDFRSEVTGKLISKWTEYGKKGEITQKER